MKFKKFLYLIVPVLMLILEAIPFSVQINVVEGELSKANELISFFDVRMFDAGAFLPFFIGIFNVILIVLILAFILLDIFKPNWDDKKLYSIIKLTTLLVVIGLLVNTFAFMSTMSITTWIIFALGIIDLFVLLKFDFTR